MPIAGRAKLSILSLNPTREIIQPVTVVPIFVPNNTPINCVRVKSPAFTKDITMTVNADEDWMIAVAIKPVKTPIKRLPVMKFNVFRMRSPALFCSPSLIIFMPNRNMQRPPVKCSKSVRIVINLCYMKSE